MVSVFSVQISLLFGMQVYQQMPTNFVVSHSAGRMMAIKTSTLMTSWQNNAGQQHTSME
jgi:hypothetical protein